jgi:wyosine [tRNA(Phe)-imidazoG37] synthetase (radical SAM superfamily)
VIETRFASVYGPVKSWRYGRSLGVDPIGPVSACSFNCAYCQLGEIELKTGVRQVFIPTAQILQDLQPFAPWDVDAITVSGSGEPTLALNLGEILAGIKELTARQTVVLTNGTLLGDPEVRAALALADKVAVKVDAVSADKLRRVNRPVGGIQLADIWAGLQEFRSGYRGKLGIQTMIITNWDALERAEYIRWVEYLAPAEIQLNTPTRPKPLKHELDARGNHSTEDRPYAVQVLKCVSAGALQEFAGEIQRATGIPVRCAPA